jgi:hypothetical protein
VEEHHIRDREVRVDADRRAALIVVRVRFALGGKRQQGPLVEADERLVIRSDVDLGEDVGELIATDGAKVEQTLKNATDAGLRAPLSASAPNSSARVPAESAARPRHSATTDTTAGPAGGAHTTPR